MFPLSNSFSTFPLPGFIHHICCGKTQKHAGLFFGRPKKPQSIIHHIPWARKKKHHPALLFGRPKIPPQRSERARERAPHVVFRSPRRTPSAASAPRGSCGPCAFGFSNRLVSLGRRSVLAFARAGASFGSPRKGERCLRGGADRVGFVR